MIDYVHGDATLPTEGARVLAHICNDAGRWGKGFVVLVGKTYPMARAEYLAMDARPLGSVRFIVTPGGVVIANRIAQQGIRTRQGVPPIRYAALEICLDLVGAYAARERLDIHMPRIGTGLAGGSWARIEQLLGAILCERYGRQVTVYDFP